MSDDTSRISPTAYYTGYVWVANSLAPAAFGTSRGRLFYSSLKPVMALGRRGFFGLTLEDLLVQRHRIIDTILTDAISTQGVRQVVEVPGGLTGRGVRFASRYPQIQYIEGDLPDMALRKAAMVASLPSPPSNLRVVSINALRDSGPESFADIGDRLLDDTAPTVMIVEGLLNYFGEDDARGILARAAAFLSRYPRGILLADLAIRGDIEQSPAARGFMRALSVFARGESHLHFADAAEADRALATAGFSEHRVHAPSDWADRLPIARSRVPGAEAIRVLEGRTGR
jgi:O-methyltransferase involved in polyketide biosynthesis